MSVKICVLRTGETVIGDIKEVIDQEENKSLGYKIEHPYVLNYGYQASLKVSEVDEEIESDREGASYTFSAWAPLAAEREFNFVFDFVDCIYEPHKAVTESYNVIVNHWLDENLNKVNVESEKTITTKNIDMSKILTELDDEEN